MNTGAVISLTVTRSSVAAGDDINAPNSSTFTVPVGSKVNKLFEAMKRDSYLPSISGGKATWVMQVDGIAVGVVAQQWDKPRFIIAETVLSAEQSVYMDYRLQVGPDELVTQLANQRYRK